MPTKVLVVDDSAISRKMLIRSLPPSWDVEISQASNGKEALEAYRKGDVELMFLDLTMPEMDGYQVLETLQQEGLNCIVFVVTADIQPEAEERVMKLGAAGFIKKPIGGENLLPVLKQYGVL
ncbi:MAG: response regulator [Gammaproteobacteria bacterium]|nr:response regulator [Gammaproteobacteria bacterium]